MLKYIGDGAFIPDCDGELVPARDLTDEEAAHFGAERLIASGLYVSEVQAERAPMEKRKSHQPSVASVDR